MFNKIDLILRYRQKNNINNANFLNYGNKRKMKPIMKKLLIFSTLLAFLTLSFTACEAESVEETSAEDSTTEELTTDSTIVIEDDPDGYYSDEDINFYADEDSRENPTQRAAWRNVWTHNFNSLHNFNKTTRFDYNSDICRYERNQVSIVGIGGSNKAVRIKAQWTGSRYKSGHIKSSNTQKYRPNNNQEYRFIAKIKLKGKNYKNQTRNFHYSSGAWPAFWTVDENKWPTKGEIDIMEGYSYGGNSSKDKFASNIFYGRNEGSPSTRNTVNYYSGSVGNGYNTYEMRWGKKNNVETVKIYVNGSLKKTYRNSNSTGLNLNKFTRHNTIFNLNVGSNDGIFGNNNSRVTIGKKNANRAGSNDIKEVIMWVDYFKIQRRSI